MPDALKVSSNHRVLIVASSGGGGDLQPPLALAIYLIQAQASFTASHGLLVPRSVLLDELGFVGQPRRHGCWS
jgi:hypothetical protein